MQQASCLHMLLQPSIFAMLRAYSCLLSSVCKHQKCQLHEHLPLAVHAAIGRLMREASGIDNHVSQHGIAKYIPARHTYPAQPSICRYSHFLLQNAREVAENTPAEKRSIRVKRSVAGALGLGAASLMAAQSADAVTEIAQLAASDNRAGILLTLLVPVLGWVAFNIAGPAFAQLDVSGTRLGWAVAVKCIPLQV
jgi:hypothetical protein